MEEEVFGIFILYGQGKIQHKDSRKKYKKI